MKFRLCLLYLLALTLPLKALAASYYLTNAQFANRGVDSFIGEVTSVQVTSSNQYLESGTVVLTVTTVTAGTLSSPTITLPFTRALFPTEDESNWDLIQPAYVSLQKIGVGKSLLIHFTQDNGAFFIAPASNSVQEATEGLIIAKILQIDDVNGWGYNLDNDQPCRRVKVQVIEVVYGWLNGSSTVSFCSHSSSDHSLLGQEVFIAFDKNEIKNIEVASTTLLQQIQQADTE